MTEQQQDPEQERRFFLAILLSMAVVFLAMPRNRAPEAPEASADPVSSVSPAAELPVAAATDGTEALPTSSSASSAAPRVEHVGWGDVEIEWSSFGGSPVAVRVPRWHEPYELDWLPTWFLNGFKNGFSWGRFDMGCKDAEPVDLIGDPSGVLLPVGVDAGGVAADVGHYELVRSSDRELVWQTRRGTVEITKTFRLPEAGYAVGYHVELRNVGGAPIALQPRFGVADRLVEAPDRYAPSVELWGEADGDVETEGLRSLAKGTEAFDGGVSWLGLGDRYFLIGMEAPEVLQGTLAMEPAGAEDRFSATAQLPERSLAAGESAGWDFTLWFGPRELKAFRDNKLRMESSVDFGMFGLVALPILAFLKVLHGLVGSWGLAIILLTFSIKAALFPLSNKSYKSMKDMQRLQPELKALQEQWKDDKERLNRETMALWQKHGVNPAGGCLPMLIQMPIWFALYQVLWNAVELYQSPFFYFCDLSMRDPIGIFPLVLGVTMWLQQKMTPNTSADPAQQAVLKYMPLFFSLLMFTLPAGLVVYILVNNILSILQQWLIQRSHGPSAAAT